MSQFDPIILQPTQQAQQMQQAQEAQQTQATTLTPTNSTSFDPNEKFSTYTDFAHKYPELHKSTMRSIAESVIGDLRRHQERMKSLQKQSQQN